MSSSSSSSSLSGSGSRSRFFFGLSHDLLSSEKPPFAAAGDFLPDAGDFFFPAAAAAAAPRVTRFLGGDGVVVGRLT